LKILLYDETQAYLCHGGKQVHAQKMYESLIELDIDVEHARWWDPDQKCDLIHMFGYSPSMVKMAQQAGVKLVFTHILDGMTNCKSSKLIVHRFRNHLIRSYFSGSIARMFSWHILPTIDALVYMHKFDAETANKIYAIPQYKTYIIPHGCSHDQIESLQVGPQNKQSYLVSVGSIVPRKNSVLLAKAAKHAKIPVVFLGKPFNEEENYYLEFLSLVDGEHVIYHGYVSDEEKSRLLTEASGFVLLSAGESGCIAVYEAAAARLPMLLSDLPWAHAYGEHTTIEHVKLNDEAIITNRLKSFFENSKRLGHPTFPVMTWTDIAKEYIKVYEKVLAL